MSDLDSLNLRTMRYFVAVATAGSISSAAADLFIAQPSLSQQILRLERQIGTTLFRRTARGVETTQAGELLRLRFEAILRDLGESVSAARSSPDVARLGVCSGVPAELLMTVERGLTTPSASRERRLQLDVRDCPSADQVLRLQSYEHDFGLVRLPWPNTGFIHALVSESPLGVVVGAQHPFREQTQLHWHQLRKQRLLWFDTARSPGFSGHVLSYVRQRGWHPELVVADSYRRSLFDFMLLRHSDLLALRPQSALAGETNLLWIPLSDKYVPREQLALVALSETRHARHLKNAAHANGWPILATGSKPGSTNGHSGGVRGSAFCSAMMGLSDASRSTE